MYSLNNCASGFAVKQAFGGESRTKVTPFLHSSQGIHHLRQRLIRKTQLNERLMDPRLKSGLYDQTN
jgi:hypothetical protein